MEQSDETWRIVGRDSVSVCSDTDEVPTAAAPGHLNVLRSYTYEDTGDSSSGDDDFFDRDSSMVQNVVIVDRNGFVEEEEDSFCLDPSQVIQYEKKIRNIVTELVETEVKYVGDVGNLCQLFDDMKYSILESCESLLSDPDTACSDISVHQIQVVNTQFLKHLKSAYEQKDEAILSKKSFLICTESELLDPESLSATLDLVQCVFECWKLFTPLFTVYANFMARHRATIMKFKSYREKDESFNAYCAELTNKYKEAYNSLMIKPVQRLPRYTLLATELKTTFDHLKSVLMSNKSLEDRFKSMLSHIGSLSVEVNVALKSCTQTCNDLVRVYEDNISLHKMYHSVKEGNIESDFSPDSLVSPHRQLIREGKLDKYVYRGSLMYELSI